MRKKGLACLSCGSQKTSDTTDEAQIGYRDNIYFPNAILSRTVNGPCFLRAKMVYDLEFLALHFSPKLSPFLNSTSQLCLQKGILQLLALWGDTVSEQC